MRIKKLNNLLYSKPATLNTPRKTRLAQKSTSNKTRKIKLYNNPVKSKQRCKYKVADSSRRAAFFRARRAGGSARPAHNQKHKRIC